MSKSGLSSQGDALLNQRLRGGPADLNRLSCAWLVETVAPRSNSARDTAASSGPVPARTHAGNQNAGGPASWRLDFVDRTAGGTLKSSIRPRHSRGVRLGHCEKARTGGLPTFMRGQRLGSRPMWIAPTETPATRTSRTTGERSRRTKPAAQMVRGLSEQGTNLTRAYGPPLLTKSKPI